MLYLKLFYEFFKTGLFTIGGGMATIPFLYRMSDATGWFTYDDLANMIAVSESTPGPIGVNMATYVGYITGMQEGSALHATLGAATATSGLITPSIIIILIVAIFLRSFRDNKYVNNAFYGLRPASMGLVAAAGLSVVINNLFEPKILESVPTEYYCNCSKERVEKAVASVGKKDLQEMIEEGKPIEVNCHFCNTSYEFTVDELKEMLKKATK